MPKLHHHVAKCLSDELAKRQRVGSSIVHEAMKVLGFHFHQKTHTIEIDGAIWSAEMWTEADEEGKSKKRVYVVHNHTVRVWYMGKFRGKEAPTTHQALVLTLQQQPHQGEPDHADIERKSHSGSASPEWASVSVESSPGEKSLLSDFE
eukprot:gene15769-11289_t